MQQVFVSGEERCDDAMHTATVSTTAAVHQACSNSSASSVAAAAGVHGAMMMMMRAKNVQTQHCLFAPLPCFK
eukprot:m.221351 g.221351  ORF g.221351 m.221351 type:complete len:73 (+) comp70074_c0_seq1:38-256(+)